MINFSNLLKVGEVEWAILLVLLVWLAAASVLIVWRKKRLERRLRLEFANLGNVETSYRVRLEDPQGLLQVRFFHNRQRLPLVSLSRPAPAQAEAFAFASVGDAREISVPRKSPWQNISLVGSISGMLTSVGSMLPGQVGKPLLQAGSKLHRGQMKYNYGRSKTERTIGFFSKGGQARQAAPPPAQETTLVVGDTWAVTPTVKPGEKLQIQVWLRSGWSAQDMIWPFRLFSCPAEESFTQPVVQEGQVQTRGGFFSHPFYPQLLVFGLAAAAVIFLFWVKSSGQLF